VTAGSSRSDLVATLLRVQQSGTTDFMDDQQVEDELMVLLFGSVDPSTGAMAWTLYRLANDSERQQAAVDEVLRVAGGRDLAELKYEDYRQMTYLTACVNESLRMYPPAPDTLRVAAEDTVLAGQVAVPKGALIMTCFYALHHNEALFEKEGEWIPERWMPDGPKELQPRAKDALMPFGAGARTCLGRQYAMLAMPVLLAQILGRVRVGRAEGAPEARIGQALVAKSVDGIYVGVV
jgi:cytochrome P450